MRRLIKGGIIPSVVNTRCDILIEDEKIADISRIIEAPNAEIIDASGCYVLPGGIDPHTHVNLNIGDMHVSDGWEAATKAAVFGGTTSIIEHPSFAYNGCGLFSQIDKTVEQAAGNSFVDYGIHAVFQPSSSEEDIPRMISMGISSGKAYMTYADMVDDVKLMSLFKAMGKNGGITAVHAENHLITEELSKKFDILKPMSHAKSRPDYCEAEAVTRAAALACAAAAPLYIVHLSTEAGLDAVRRAKKNRHGNFRIYAETCPQYLLLTEDMYEADNGIDFIMAPPLRRKRDCEALWEGIKDGTVDAIGTDHCSFSHEDKFKSRQNIFKIPGGVPGIETRIPLLFSEGVMKNRISLQRFAEIVSEAPARIFGIRDKGTLRKGADADIIIIDPKANIKISHETLHQKADYTPFEGMYIQGGITHVLLRGKIMIENGNCTGAKDGRFIKRYN